MLVYTFGNGGCVYALPLPGGSLYAHSYSPSGWLYTLMVLVGRYYGSGARTRAHTTTDTPARTHAHTCARTHDLYTHTRTPYILICFQVRLRCERNHGLQYPRLRQKPPHDVESESQVRSLRQLEADSGQVMQSCAEAAGQPLPVW